MTPPPPSDSSGSTGRRGPARRSGGDRTGRSARPDRRQDAVRGRDRSAGSGRGDGRGRRGGDGTRDPRAAEGRDGQVVRKGWGSVARRGASAVRVAGDGHRNDGDTPEGRRRSRTRSDDFVPERWVRTDPEPRAKTATTRTATTRTATSNGLHPRGQQTDHRRWPSRTELPADLARELASAAGADWGLLSERVTERMLSGIGAYERERYRDAARMLKTVVDAVPDAPSARELLGLSQYHQGHWKVASVNLEAYATLTGSVDQHPVRMDCQRAQGRPRRVETLFAELRQGSPDPEVLSEGRLVLAGTRADLGDLGAAITLLVEAGAGRMVRSPAERHLRQWYVLADLMERSGDVVKARELFSRIQSFEPDAYDVRDRLEPLGRRPTARSRTRRPTKPPAGAR